MFIPKKHYESIQNASYYNVLIRRRNNRSGYDVRVTVPVETKEWTRKKRLMTLDINAGHIDFSVTEKDTLKPVVLGKINCNRLLFSSKEENKKISHAVVKKICNLVGTMERTQL